MSNVSHVTFALIKPMTVGRGQVLDVLKVITDNDFIILKLKKMHKCPTTIAALYAEHKGKSYYGDLIAAMLSNQTIPLLLGRLDDKDAIKEFRKVVGPTLSLTAPKHTIRGQFGGHLYRGPDAPINDNAIHASDSPQAVQYESGLFFKDAHDIIRHFNESVFPSKENKESK